jgi:hypothetical protein
MDHATVMLAFMYLFIGFLMGGILLVIKPVNGTKPTIILCMSLILLLWLPLSVLSLSIAALTGKAFQDPFL